MRKYEFRFMFKSEKNRVPYEELAELSANTDSEAVLKFFDILGSDLVDDLEYMTFRRL